MRESGSVTLILPGRRRRRLVGVRRAPEAPAVLHPPARPVGLIGGVGRHSVHSSSSRRRLASFSRAGRDAGIGRASSARRSSRRRLASRSQPRRPCAVESSGGSSSPRAIAELLVLDAVDFARPPRGSRARSARSRGWRAGTRWRAPSCRRSRSPRRCTSPASAHSSSTSPNSSPERRLVALAEPRDRRVIRRLVGRDHPDRDVLTAAPLDPPRGPLTDRVRVEQQRHHHRRIVRRPTPAVLAIAGEERRRSIASTASSTNHARWSSGSHSRRLGGNNSSCSRSHAMKFCAIPESS